MSQMIDMQTGAQQAATYLNREAFQFIVKHRVCKPSNTFKENDTKFAKPMYTYCIMFHKILCDL